MPHAAAPHVVFKLTSNVTHHPAVGWDFLLPSWVKLSIHMQGAVSGLILVN